MRNDLPYIRQAVTVRDAAVALGLNPDRRWRCRCVWHEDSHPSLKLYDGEKGCWCFACHNGGDVIDLTMQALGVPLKGAVAWLNETFRLGLERNAPSDRKAVEAARKAAEKRKRKREARERQVRERFDLWCDTVGMTKQTEALLTALEPKVYGEDFSDAFCKALELRTELRELAEDIAADMNGVKV